MSQVVFRLQPSVHAAYRAQEAQVGTSVVSVYNKRKEIAPHTSAALVRSSAHQLAPLITQLGGNRVPWLRGYQVKSIDGNCLEARAHRLAVLRGVDAGALPGKALVVSAPAQGVVRDVCPCEDGHAQERSLVGCVLKTVQAGDLWMADRHFCTRDLLCDMDARGACFVIREHRGLPFEILTPLRPRGRVETGKMAEQRVRGVDGQGGTQTFRRLRIQLDHATRDGALYLDKCTRSHGLGQAGGPAVSHTLDAGDGLPASGGLFSCCNQYVGLSQSGVVRVLPGLGRLEYRGGRVGGFTRGAWPGKRG